MFPSSGRPAAPWFSLCLFLEEAYSYQQVAKSLPRALGWRLARPWCPSLHTAMPIPWDLQGGGTQRLQPLPRTSAAALTLLHRPEPSLVGKRPLPHLPALPTARIPHPTSQVLHPASPIQHPASHILHPTSYVPHPTSNVPYPTFDVLDPHQQRQGHVTAPALPFPKTFLLQLSQAPRVVSVLPAILCCRMAVPGRGNPRIRHPLKPRGCTHQGAGREGRGRSWACSGV